MFVESYLREPQVRIFGSNMKPEKISIQIFNTKEREILKTVPVYKDKNALPKKEESF